MTFILIHGSWHNGSVWQRVEERLKSAGIAVYAPTLSGFESIRQPAAQDIGLHTHILDVVSLIGEHDLSDVILVGHSYGGFVMTGVAEQIPERIAKLIYLDAFIPEDNQSLFDILGPESAARFNASLLNADGRTRADGAEAVWLLPPGQPSDYGVTNPQDAAWLQAHLVYTPVLTFAEKLRLGNPQAQSIPRYFIRCTAFPFLEPSERKAIADGWPVFHIPTGHDAMLTEPTAVTDILLSIASQ